MMTSFKSSLALAALLMAAGANAQTGGLARIVRHTPRLQLGEIDVDSPTDQVALIWQTIDDLANLPFGSEFVVEYRKVGEDAWTPAGDENTFRAGDDASRPAPDTNGPVARFARYMHEVFMTGLDFNTKYEYKWQHIKGGDVAEVREFAFTTRLPKGDPTPFSFISNGDSCSDTAEGWSLTRALNKKLGEDGLVSFGIGNGDLAYNTGTHTEFDQRFMESISPEQTDFMAQFIEFHTVGNHDVGGSGFAVQDNYVSPGTPIANNLARDEAYYSFDWGVVHFTVWEGNVATGADNAEKDAMLEWIRADFEASDAKWKVGLCHHPIGGSPDKSQGPDDLYWKEIVQIASDVGVDLLISGHSHTYSRSFPLIPGTDDTAAWVEQPLGQYEKGLGIVQVVAGMAGQSLRSGEWDDDNEGRVGAWVAAGYSTQTTPAVEYGIAKIDVTPDAISVSYLRAPDGGVIDTFTIVDKKGASARSVQEADQRVRAMNAPLLEQHDCATCATNAACVRTVDERSVCQCAYGFYGNGQHCEQFPVLIDATEATLELSGVKTQQVLSSQGQRAVVRAVAGAMKENFIGEVDEETIEVRGLAASSSSSNHARVTLAVYTKHYDAWDVRDAFTNDDALLASIATHLRKQTGFALARSVHVVGSPESQAWEKETDNDSYPIPMTMARETSALRGSTAGSADDHTTAYAAIGASVGVLALAGAAVAGAKVWHSKKKAENNARMMAANQA